jgi:hypothetical protein
MSTNNINHLLTNNQSTCLKNTEPPVKPYLYFRMEAEKKA